MLSIVQRLPLGGWVRSVACTICRTLRAVIRRLGPRPGAVAVRAVRPPCWKRRRQNNTVTKVVRRARATPRLETPAEASRMRRARKATWRGDWGASRQASRMRRCSGVRGRGVAESRGFRVVQVYEDGSSGARASRPGLDQLLADARRGKFEVVLVWASDRLARSVTHFLQVLDELNHLGIEFVSFREQLDTGGPLGRAMVVIISAIAELVRDMIVGWEEDGVRSVRVEGVQE